MLSKWVMLKAFLPFPGPRRKLDLKLWTSAYWLWRSEWGLVPVRITLGRPRAFPSEYEELLSLAPWGRLFNLEGEEFEEAYRMRLERVGVEHIRAGLDAIAERHPGAAGLCLLCYENVFKGQQCHRRSFAEWWLEKTGEVIEEVPPNGPPSGTSLPVNVAQLESVDERLQTGGNDKGLN